MTDQLGPARIRMTRREFLNTLSGLTLALGLDGCLTVDEPLAAPNGLPLVPPRIMRDLQGVCRIGESVTVDGMTVWKHPWPDGIDAAALIDIDDLCPVYLPEDGLDFGGDLTDGGTLRSFVVGELLRQYPDAKVNLMLIANMRQNPILRRALGGDDRYLLSKQRDWVRQVSEILADTPGLRIAMHGYWHYNGADNSAREFLQYDAHRTREIMVRMHSAIIDAFPGAEQVFRAPGWSATPPVLDYLSDAGFLLADSSAASTFTSSVPSCMPLQGGKDLVHGGPDFRIGLTDGIRQGAFIVSHFHWTEPNANSLSRATVRQVARDFARAISTHVGGNTDWMSYWEAADSVARAGRSDFTVSAAEGALAIILAGEPSDMQRVTLGLVGRAGRELMVRTATDTPVLFDLRSSVRGCEYVVLKGTGVGGGR